MIRCATTSAVLLCAVVVSAQAQSLRLAWDPPPGDVAVSYVVERGTSAGTYTITYPVEAGATSLTLTDLTAGKKYFFIVRTVDAKGVRSAPSNEIWAVVKAADDGSGGGGEDTDSGGDDGSDDSEPEPEPPPPPPPPPLVLTINNEAALRQALATPRSNLELRLATGTYRLTSPLVVTGGVQDVTIRSLTGRTADVVVLGPPPTAVDPQPSAIVASRVTRLTVADVTIRGVAGHAISLGHGVHEPRLQGLRIIDNAQFVQSLLHADQRGARSGLIEGCSFEYVGTATDLPSGIDIRGGRGWVLRGNRFIDTRPREQVVFGPSIIAWQGSSGTVVDRNVFINATREIVLGLSDRWPHQHTGGFVRNNMIVRRAATGSRGPAISVLDSPETVVLHNTMFLAGTSSVAIDYAHPDTQQVVILNNLTDAAITGRDSAWAIVNKNVLKATASMFVSLSRGDLRLRPDAARLAIDAGIFNLIVLTDAEGDARPDGAAPDVGADEVVK